MANRWQTLMDLRQRRVDQAQEQVIDSARRKQEAITSINQIRQYIKEYQGAGAIRSQTVSVDKISRSRKFMIQLQDALKVQEAALIQLTTLAQKDLHELIRCRADLKAIEKLKDSKELAIKKIADKKEANELDELARTQYLVNIQR